MKTTGLLARLGLAVSGLTFSGLAVSGLAVSGLALLAGCNGGSGGGGGGGGSPGAGSGDGGADLVGLDLGFSPTEVEAGAPILVTDVVRNIGIEAAGAFRVGIYLSSDAVVSKADVLLGFRTVPGLQPGASSTGGGELSVPPTTSVGQYWVGAVVDDLDEVSESDELHNTVLGPGRLDVSAPDLPNLVGAAVTFSPFQVDAGELIDVTDQVENHGTSAAGPFQVGIYLSSDPTVTTADTLLGLRSVGGLDPGNASQGHSPLTVPLATPEGLYWLGAIADDADEVIEPNELDNVVVAGATLEVHQPPLSDLVPSFVTFSPGTVDAGQNIAISEGVLNQGDASAAGFQVGVYLSTDPVLDAGDVLLGLRLVGTLDPGSESTVSGLPVQIPPDTPAGTYFVGTWADDTELVPEQDEGNNRLVALSSLTVTVPPLPDLLSQEIQFSPGVINADLGELLHVQELVENHGPAGAGSFRVGVYLSPNSVVTATDILISSRLVSALGPGAGTGAAVDVELPVGVSDGTYYVGVIADYLGEVGELSEGNNVLLAGGTLDVVSSPDPKANLITEDVTYSGNKRQPGDTFQLITRVTNTGDLSAPPFHVGVYLSLDDQITTDDTLIGERFLLAGLGAGFSSVASAPVTIPVDTPVGDYYVGAVADNRFAVEESDEDDNDFRALGTLEVFIPPPPTPELGVTTISHDGSVHVPGDTISIEDTIHNDGEVDAGAFRVAYFLSDDAQISTDDLLLATRTVVSLLAGEESSDTTVIVIPPGTAPGTWWLGVVVDDQDSVAENDEDDNDKTALPSIEVQ